MSKLQEKKTINESNVKHPPGPLLLKWYVNKHKETTDENLDNFDITQSESSRKHDAVETQTDNVTVSDTDSGATTNDDDKKEPPTEESQEKHKVALNDPRNEKTFDGIFDSDNLYKRLCPRSVFLDSQTFTQRYSNKRHGNLLSVFCINANNYINKNYGKIGNYLENLQKEWHVMGIVETWLKGNEIPKRIRRNGYTFLSRNREPEKKGGGVGLYVRNDIDYVKRDDMTIPVDGCTTPCDSLFIEIRRPTGKNIIVGVVYIPPKITHTNKLNRKFVASFQNVLTSINRENKNSVIMGDYNINLFLKEERTTNFVKTLFNNDHYPLINRPTRVTDKSATLIDNFITNVKCEATEITAGILESKISDHYPIFTLFSEAHVHVPSS